MRTILIILFCLAFVASHSSADEYILVWNNPNPSAITGLNICIDGLCERVDTSCDAFQTCEVQFTALPGEHSIIATAVTEAEIPSLESNALEFTTPARCFGLGDEWECNELPSNRWRFDINGDGNVSTTDFAQFLREWSR